MNSTICGSSPVETLISATGHSAELPALDRELPGCAGLGHNHGGVRNGGLRPAFLWYG